MDHVSLATTQTAAQKNMQTEGEDVQFHKIRNV